MKLAEQIYQVLESIGKPLTALEIADEINRNARYRETNRSRTSNLEVRFCVINYPSSFEEIDGRIILTNDKKWKIFLESFSYLQNTLRGFYSNSELQLIIAVLFFSKRIVDCGNSAVYSFLIPESHNFYDIKFNSKEIDFEDWLGKLPELDQLNNHSYPIFSEFQSLIGKIGKAKASELLSFMRSVDTRSFDLAEFGIAFEHLIEINITDNYKSGLIRTPPQIIELMVRLLDPREGSIYDPVCGVGGFFAEVKRRKGDGFRLKGNEVAIGVAQLAFMNLLMQGGKLPEIQASNCFDELSSSQKFDYIVGDLPFLGIQNNSHVTELSNFSNIKLPQNGKGFSSIVIFALAKLNDLGKAVLTVSNSFLTAGGADEKVRRLLINEDLIEAIINLPVNSLKPYTNGKTSVLILNREKPLQLRGRIKFINAARHSTEVKSSAFDSQEVIDCYHKHESISEIIEIVESSDVIRNHTLLASFYTERNHKIEDNLRNENAMRLGDLVEIRAGTALVKKEHANFSDGIPYVRIENLEKDILDMKLSSDGLVHHFIDTAEYRGALINGEALIVARVGDHLKPTYFQPNDGMPQIIIHSNVISLRPLKQEALNLEYLYYQLYSPFVQKQVEQNRTGTVMPSITLTALRNLIIPFVSVAHQLEFVATQKASIIASERERVSQRLRLVGLEEQEIQTESEVVSTLVHELRPKLLSFHTFAESLLAKLENVQIVDIAVPVNDKQILPPDLVGLIEDVPEYSIKEIAEKMVHDARKLNDVLSLVKDVMGFHLQLEDFARTDVTALIRNHLEERNSTTLLKFKWDVSLQPVFAHVHSQSLKYLLDQLIKNAEEHGFKTTSPNNKMSFSVRENKARGIMTIEYTNNGEPMRISENEYVSFFAKSKSSSGSGIGGNYIYRIVKSHRGILKIKEHQDRGFFMTIELPVQQVHND